MSGKTLRLKRFIAPHDGRVIIFPLDHGVSCGPESAPRDMDETIRMGIRAGTDALVLHKGMMRFLHSVGDRLPGIFMHVSASTQLGPSIHRKVLVGTVEEAIRRGADGISVHVNLGDTYEPEMLRDLGIVGNACAEWQIPLLVMIYIRGVHAPSPLPDASVEYAARVAAELGADIIKIPSPQDSALLAKIARTLPVPVVIAGGTKSPDVHLFLERISGAMQAGVRGVAVGRNVFQDERPESLFRAIRHVVHEGFSASMAWDEYQREQHAPS